MRSLRPWERRPWAWVLAAACLISYANGLAGGFTYDDKAIVRDDPRIQSTSRLPEIFTTQYFGGSLTTGTAYRPVDLLSFAANYAVHGKTTFGYHLVNVFLHGANVLLLFVLLRERFPEDVAGTAALLFAVMPVHVEAVTSIVGRAEVLSTLFVLWAVILALRARDRRSPLRYVAACAAFLVAMFTKESAVVFPGIVFLFDLADGRGRLFRRASDVLKRRPAFYAGFAIPVALMFAARLAVLKGLLISRYAGIFELENPLVSLRFFPRLGNAAAILMRDLGRIVFPLYLSADESMRQLPILRTSDPLFWIALAAVGSLLAAAAALFFRRRAVGLGLLLFFVGVLPTANLIFVTGTVMAERVLYLPSAGIALSVAAALVGVGPGRTPRRLALVLGVVLAFSARTIVRNSVWDSDRALFANLVETSPDSAKAHYDLAYDVATRRAYWPAYRQYRKATELFGDYYDAWAGRARMAGEIGDLREAVACARRSVKILPTYENGWYWLAFSAERQGDWDAARKAYEDAVAKCPKSYPIAYHRAAFLWRRGRTSEAVAELQRCERLSQDLPLVHEDLGRIFAAAGDSESAEEEWDDALALLPTDSVALGGLARIAEGRSDFAEGARIRRRLFEATRERADLLLLLRDAERAPGSGSEIGSRWAAWALVQPALFAEPAIAAWRREHPAQ